MKTSGVGQSSWWKGILTDESGQDLIEYALVAAVIGLAAVISLKGLTTRIVALYTAGGNYLAALLS